VRSKATDTLKKYTMFIMLVVVVILFEVLLRLAGRGTFFNSKNMTNLISQNAYVLILATGMLMCILTGGNIDLSVGSLVAFVGAIAGKIIVENHGNIYAGIAVCLLIGLVAGVWNAIWIAYVRIPAFIVTLSSMMVFRGLTHITLGGYTLSPFPKNYQAIFNGYPSASMDERTRYVFTMGIGAFICIVFLLSQILGRQSRKKKGYEVESIIWIILKFVIITFILLGIFHFLGGDRGIPYTLILLAAIVGVYSFITSKTVPGRNLYAIGGNEKAAKLSGINTNRTLFFAYTNMGFLSGVAALVCVGRYSAAMPTLGTSYEMDAIASCFIGGAATYGGIGTVFGAVVGALLMGVLNNGMQYMGLDPNWQLVIKGMVLLAAVAFDVISKKRARAL